ncbi:MAG: AF1514 family protein [Thiohalomonadales bacterium]
MAQSDYKTISVNIEGKALDFALAKRISEELASSVVTGPMLVAWFDGKKNEEHPNVPECQHKPGWLAYADGHGGCVRINVNGDEYNFVFAESGIAEE